MEDNCPICGAVWKAELYVFDCGSYWKRKGQISQSAACTATELAALKEWGQRMAYYLDWLIDLYPAEKPRAEAMKVQARTLGLVEE